MPQVLVVRQEWWGSDEWLSSRLEEVIFEAGQTSFIVVDACGGIRCW